jgi:hypothetical protein
VPAPDGPALDPLRLFQTLDRHGVDYLVVGGSAARAYGATRLTDDADCVVDRHDDNLERLAGALRELNARLRVYGMSDEEAKQLPVQLDSRGLRQMGLTTWMTDVGPVDFLDGLEDRDGRTVPYQELASRAVVIDVSGTTVQVAALDDIITAKEHADRPKDREALPELRAIRAASPP